MSFTGVSLTSAGLLRGKNKTQVLFAGLHMETVLQNNVSVFWSSGK